MMGTIRRLAMNTSSLASSHQKQQQAINAFLDKLWVACKTNIINVYLFGSQARGDIQQDSDIDILVIAAQSDWRLKHQISHIAADVGLEYDVLIDAHIIQESRWKEIGEAGYRFYKNVMDEGVSLVSVR
jgi:predicted nucleotidyltransferase